MNIMGIIIAKTMVLTMSSVYIKSNRGPKMDPCGTPKVTYQGSRDNPSPQHISNSQDSCESM